MERIASFSVDHMRLKKGLYLSRKDTLGDCLTSSFDIRMKKPNREDAMAMAELHTLEHLGATFLRNHKVWAERVVYFGPMGCRTGCYLVLFGDYIPEEILSLMREIFTFMSKFEGDIPGATAIECGNYLDHDLDKAKEEAANYLMILNNVTLEELRYPE